MKSDGIIFINRHLLIVFIVLASFSNNVLSGGISENEFQQKIKEREKQYSQYSQLILSTSEYDVRQVDSNSMNTLSPNSCLTSHANILLNEKEILHEKELEKNNSIDWFNELMPKIIDAYNNKLLPSNISSEIDKLIKTNGNDYSKWNRHEAGYMFGSAYVYLGLDELMSSSSRPKVQAQYKETPYLYLILLHKLKKWEDPIPKLTGVDIDQEYRNRFIANVLLPLSEKCPDLSLVTIEHSFKDFIRYPSIYTTFIKQDNIWETTFSIKSVPFVGFASKDYSSNISRESLTFDVLINGDVSGNTYWSKESYSPDYKKLSNITNKLNTQPQTVEEASEYIANGIVIFNRSIARLYFVSFIDIYQRHCKSKIVNPITIEMVMTEDDVVTNRSNQITLDKKFVNYYDNIYRKNMFNDFTSIFSGRGGNRLASHTDYERVLTSLISGNCNSSKVDAVYNNLYDVARHASN